MKPKEIRKKSAADIRSEIEDARETYFKLRFQFATGQLSDHTRLKFARREIARLETILRDIERESEKERSE